MAARATGFNGVCTMAVADDEHAIGFSNPSLFIAKDTASVEIVLAPSNPSLFIAKDTASVEIVLASSHVIVSL